MHLGNTEFDGIVGVLKAHFSPVNLHISIVIRIDAVKDIEKGRFTRAVFPKEGVYLPFIHRKIHTVQRLVAGELLCYIRKMYHCRHILSPL